MFITIKKGVNMCSKMQMQYETNKKVHLFNKYLKKLSTLDNVDNWHSFATSLLSSIEMIYGKDTIKYYTILDLINSFKIEYFSQYKQYAKEQIESAIEDVKAMNDMKLKKDTTVVHNEFSPNVSQIVNTNFIMSTIENQLPPVTMNEIKEILQADEKPEKKKGKILEAVKSTGENILAKIITEFITKEFTGQ